MDNQLNYQQARRLRGTSLGKVFADQLDQNATVGGAIKKTISLKMQSQVKGMKERIDPLNIAKFLTFGSSWAPALLGHLTGRSHEDTRYFSGRLKPIVVKDKSKKVTPLPKDGEQLVEGRNTSMKGLNKELMKIYKLIKKSNESEQKRREMESNFAEEKEQEAERRHKEFMRVLSAITGGESASVILEEGDNKSSPLDKLFDALWPKLLTKVPLLGWLAAYVTVPALAGYLFNEYWKKEQAQQSAENIQVATERGGDVAGQAAAELERMRQTGEDQDPMNDEKVKQLIEQRDDGAKRRDYFREEFLRSSGYRKTTSMFSKVPVYKDSAKKEPPADTMQAANQYAEEQTQKIFTGEVKDPLGKFVYKTATPAKPETKTETKPATSPATQTSNAGGGTGGQGGASLEKAGQNTTITSGGTTAAPVTTAPAATQQLNAAMAENADAQLPKQQTEDKVTVNNIVSKSKKDNRPLDRLSDLNIRNDEPTLLRMIMASTRVV